MLETGLVFRSQQPLQPQRLPNGLQPEQRRTESPGNQPPQPPAKPPSRLPFWFGFFTSFLFLSMASLGLLLLSTAGDNFDLGTLQGGETAWTPPEIIPTPTPGESVASAANAAVVDNNVEGADGIGTLLRNVTSGNVRIRQTPGNLSKPANDIIAGIAAGDQVEIVGGPAAADGLTWWQVRYTTANGQTIDGWSAEVTPSGLRILGPE